MWALCSDRKSYVEAVVKDSDGSELSKHSLPYNRHNVIFSRTFLGLFGKFGQPMTLPDSARLLIAHKESNIYMPGFDMQSHMRYDMKGAISLTYMCTNCEDADLFLTNPDFVVVRFGIKSEAAMFKLTYL